MHISGFCELTLESEEPAGLARFYRECFGLPEIERQPDYVWLAVGRHARLGLWRPGIKQFGDEGGVHVHFAFSVDPGGLDGIVQQLQRAGVEFRGPVAHDGGDQSLYVRDPEGNVVEVWDYVGREGTVIGLGDERSEAEMVLADSQD